MRVYIAGQKLFGVAVLALCLQRGDTVLGVSAPLYRGDGEHPDRLREAATRAGIPVAVAGSLRANTLPDGVDVILAAHSFDYIGAATRRKAKLGALGFHPSLLPLHRGRDAVRWALRMRERVTGGTVFWLNDGVDTGAIAAQQHVLIAPQDDPESLWREKLFPVGVRLFNQVLADLDRGVIVREAQDPTLATWEPSIQRAPLFRPELPQIGPPPEGFTVVPSRELATRAAATATVVAHEMR